MVARLERVESAVDRIAQDVSDIRAEVSSIEVTATAVTEPPTAWPDDYGGTAGAFFEMWLDQQLSELGLTRADLRAWRPAAQVRGRRRARVAA